MQKTHQAARDTHNLTKSANENKINWNSCRILSSNGKVEFFVVQWFYFIRRNSKFMIFSPLKSSLARKLWNFSSSPASTTSIWIWLCDSTQITDAIWDQMCNNDDETFVSASTESSLSRSLIIKSKASFHLSMAYHYRNCCGKFLPDSMTSDFPPAHRKAPGDVSYFHSNNSMMIQALFLKKNIRVDKNGNCDFFLNFPCS